MPGHVDGFTCFATLTFGSKSPMTYTRREWTTIERTLGARLRSFRLPGHETKEATLISMLPTATSISKHAIEVDRTLAALAKRRPPSRRAPRRPARVNASRAKPKTRRSASRRSRG